MTSKFAAPARPTLISKGWTKVFFAKSYIARERGMEGQNYDRLVMYMHMMFMCSLI